MSGASAGLAEPYVGPRPFEASESHLFFGRQREAHEISSLVLANRFFMLYASSGAGKTSLVNAGVLPLVKDELEVLPAARFLAGASRGSGGVANVFTYAVLSAWADPADLGELTRTTLRDFVAGLHRPSRPFQGPKPRLLVLDQFEELFTTHPERWQDRRKFLEQLADASNSDPDLRILVVLREDYLSRLLGFADTFYGGLKDRYFLEPLRKPAAELAITGPLRGTGRSFESAAAADLVRKLVTSRVDLGDSRIVQVEGEFVEPVLLQVVCQKLWAALPADVSLVTSANVDDVSTSLADFYSEAVRNAAQLGLASEGRIRDWVQQHLLTHPGGTRGTVHAGPETTAGLPNAVVERLVGTLLRAEFRAGARWLEITHDSLLGPIEQSNADFFRAEGPLAQQADTLALAVARHCQTLAVAHRLNDPFPLPVRWAAASTDLMPAWEELARPAASDVDWPASSGIWATAPAELAGNGSDLADVLARVPSRRLVVLGEPGSGKTMLMVRLVLELLARRVSGAPVPVLVSAASWDPATQDLHRWLSDQLTASFPAVVMSAPHGDRSGIRMRELLAAGLILPVLDGLDEVPDIARRLAITRINDALGPGQSLVVTCRTRQYQDAVRPPDDLGVMVRAAAAVELAPLRATDVAGYLRASEGGKERAGRWDSVLAVLGTQAPAGQALDTPLMVSLARAIYSPHIPEHPGEQRDPAELCDPALPDRAAVERYLFAAFIPAAYPRAADGRWTAGQAGQWLTFIARQLEQTSGSPGFAWWQLARATPRAALGLTAGLAFGLAIAITAGLALGTRWLALTAAAGLALATALVAGLARDQQPSPGPRWSPRRGLAVAVPAGVVIGITGGLASGVVAGLTGALVSACALLLNASLQAGPGDRETAARPQTALSHDRRSALTAGAARGAAAGTAIGIWAGIAIGIWQGLVLALLSVLTVGLVAMSLESAWPQWLLARSWLALRYQLPWRLMAFLADAHSHGVLQQYGPYYQFRHNGLQQCLAAQTPDGTRLIPGHPVSASGRRWLAPAVSAIMATVVVAGFVAVSQSLYQHSASRPRQHRHTPPTISPSSGPPSASAEARAISALLAASAFSRTSLAQSITYATNCTNLAAAVSQLQLISNGRQAQLSKAEGLSTAALPDGSMLKSDLIIALQYSLNADNAYLLWAEQQQAACHQGSQPNAGAYNRGATNYKRLFARLWNPIAIQFGLQQVSPDHI